MREERNNVKKRKKMTGRKKSMIKLAILGVEIVLLAVLLVAFFFVKKLSLIDRDNEHMHTEVDQNELEDDVKETLKGYTTIALMGLDNRDMENYDWGNADTIIIASINNETKEIRLVSVYRDTYLQVTEDGVYSRINSSYNRGDGPMGVVEALNRNMDLNIQDYVTVNWRAVAETVDLMGGIEVELTQTEANVLNQLIKEQYEEVEEFRTDRVAREGKNQLDGAQTLAFARMRKLVGDDYARTERQRLVIQKMLEKAKQCSIGTLVKIIDEVFPEISTSLTNMELIEMASGILSYSLTETTGFPEKRGYAEIAGISSYIVPVSLLDNVEDLHEFLYGNDKFSPSIQLQEISNHIIKQSGLAPEIEEEEE